MLPIVQRLLNALLRLTLRSILWLLAGSILLVGLFRFMDPPGSALMLYRWLEHQGEHYSWHYQWRSWPKLPTSLALAVIAAEDQHFPDHYGFDFESIQANLVRNQSGRSLRGGSTISQQVAKNLFLWPDRSYLRKGLEAWFTLWIECLWSKQRILEIYLNLIELDKGVFGAEAASRHFFNKSSRELSLTDSALLAAVLPNPFIYRVDKPSARVRARQVWILRQIQQLGGRQLLERL